MSDTESTSTARVERRSSSSSSSSASRRRSSQAANSAPATESQPETAVTSNVAADTSSSVSDSSTNSDDGMRLDDIQEVHSERSKPEKKKIETYGDKCIAYWKAYVDPYVWTSMPVCVVIGVAFWSLKFIPNYHKCMLAQSIFAIIGGVIIGSLPRVQAFIKHKKVKLGIAFSKQQFMRLAVILYGFRVKLEDIEEVGGGGAVGSILMVVVTFLIGCGLGHLLKIPLGQSGVIATGFAICGIAAILSSAALFGSSPEETSLAAVFVIVGGFLDIVIYPSLYAARSKLGWNDKSFGVAAGISIKEIAHTVSVGLSCSAEVSKYAMIVKMFKVLLLPFLLIILAFTLPPILKCAEDRKAERERKLKMREGLDPEDSDEEQDEEESCKHKCTVFWGKVSIPYFALLFILMTIINSNVNISQKAHDILDEIIQAGLCVSMFCVGITTDLRQLARASNWRPFVLFIIMYIWVFGFGWFLQHFLFEKF